MCGHQGMAKIQPCIKCIKGWGQKLIGIHYHWALPDDTEWWYWKILIKCLAGGTWWVMFYKWLKCAGIPVCFCSLSDVTCWYVCVNHVPLLWLFQMKALQGMKASYRLQKVFHSSNPVEAVRGRRFNEENQPQALNAFLYSLLRPNRSHRRGLLTSILNLFDDSAVSECVPGACCLINQ